MIPPAIPCPNGCRDLVTLNARTAADGQIVYLAATCACTVRIEADGSAELGASREAMVAQRDRCALAALRKAWYACADRLRATGGATIEIRATLYRDWLRDPRKPRWTIRREKPVARCACGSPAVGVYRKQPTCERCLNPDPSASLEDHMPRRSPIAW